MRRSTRAKGSTVDINTLPASIVYSDTGVGQRLPGGGYTWGVGPRVFVGAPRPPSTVVEVGRPGDFPIGGDGNKLPDELGYPHGTRWAGWPTDWEPPFFDKTGMWWGRFGFGGPLLEGRISTVFACIDLISRTLSTMKILQTRDSEPIPATPWTENPEPELYTSIVDFTKCFVNSLLMRGETFVVATARYADNTVARMVVLNPDMVQVDENSFGLPTYTLPEFGEIPRAEILHVRYQTWPGLAHGVGPLEAAARNLASADALERYGTELAVSNGIPTAVLQSATKLTKDQATDLKRSWAEAALSRGVLPAVLSGGLTYTPLNLKPSDIGLLDLRTFDEARIASVFGVPLWFVGLPMADGLTYTTVEGTFDFLWRATLRAMSFNMMQALSGWALPRGQWVRHDSESLVRPTIEGRANAYKTMIESGVLTVDEARAIENLPPIQAASDSAAILAQTTDGGL